MKIAILGAGHIGGAIAASLAQGHLYNENEIIVSNPSPGKLELLQKQYPYLQTTTDNHRAVSEADLVILAVNPRKIDEVLRPLRLSRSQILISLAAGISIVHLAHFVNAEMPIFRAVPNLAISEHSGFTLLASRGATQEQQQLVQQIFEEGGKCRFLEEEQLDTASALTSSGLAFALKYMQAAMQAGMELGIPSREAMEMVAHSMEGAAELILNHATHPCLEIDKIATPGGVTIKGLNELERTDFTYSIIQAIKTSAMSVVDKMEQE